MKCNKCRLGEGATQVVYGDGPINAQLIIIGEAPGFEEDKAGKPFVGASGNLLRSALYKVGIPPSYCYITNVCKCRPPQNRTPLPDEIEACREYLEQELKLVDAPKILLLGEVALSSFGLSGITRERGTIREIDGRLVMATYHPAFLFRARDLMPVFFHDIQKLANTSKIVLPKEDYVFNPPFEFLSSYLDMSAQDWIAVDIETAGDKSDEDAKGLNPFKDTIIGISFSKFKPSAPRAIQLSMSKFREYIEFLKIFLSNYPYLVFQNNLFDRMFLNVQLGIKVKTPVWDTQTAMHIINSNLPKKLDFLRSIYTNEPPYKTKQNYANNLNWLNAKDTDITLQVALIQTSDLEPKQHKLMTNFLQYDDVALHMKIQGVSVSRETIQKHYDEMKPKETEILNLFKENYGVDINSPLQLANLLFNELGLEPIKFGKRYPSTDEETLTELSAKNPDNELLNLILKYRELKTLTSKYCEGLLALIQPDGKLHPDWRTLGTDTGRWACKKPNMQNFPKNMRDIIVPDDETHLFIGADYNRIELFVAAILSEDLDLLHILESGEDVHSEALKAIDEVYPLTEKLGREQARRRAKEVVFGTLYGRTSASLAKEFKVKKEVAQKWQDAFYHRFKKLHKFMEETIVRQWQTRGYVETPFGFKKYTEQVTQAKNHVIQGTAAEIMKMAGLELYRNGFDLRISVHDQWVAQVPKETAEESFKKFLEIMETSAKSLYERFPAEGGIGKTWKEV